MARRAAGEPRAAQPAAAPASPAGRVIERPDGFYWERAPGEARGPYATLAEAEAEARAGSTRGG